MLLQIPKKWTEKHLELANVRLTTGVPAEEIVDPIEYLRGRGREWVSIYFRAGSILKLHNATEFEEIANPLNTTPNGVKKTGLDHEQEHYCRFRRELSDLRGKNTVVGEDDLLFPHIGVLTSIIEETTWPAGIGDKW